VVSDSRFWVEPSRHSLAEPMCSTVTHGAQFGPRLDQPSQQQGAQMGIFSQTSPSRAKIFPRRGKRMIFFPSSLALFIWKATI
jgi:hypothetical protein